MITAAVSPVDVLNGVEGFACDVLATFASLSTWGIGVPIRCHNAASLHAFHPTSVEICQGFRCHTKPPQTPEELESLACFLHNAIHFLFKFLVIGSAGTGKSCLLHQFIENKFKQDSNHTIGVEFGSKVVNVGGKTVKLQIWDTAGQERFRSVTRSYYRGAAGALLVYDITSRETYNALTNWLTDARTLASPNIVIILCGNKKDLDADREVTFLEASRFAQENELMFLETSALTGENVEEAFLKCARTILNKIESGELDPERMGSGIQYGDASLRQLRQPRSMQTQNKQQCNC
ncbi:ras-related protein Rab-4B [Narcine bancroftii]|uniref:ras-related protein Rab-4B n=1 Tax=Narcine bancroftii TaxID=1343680 RepID=UPI003831D73D